jgi:hypothetical protein
MYPTGKLDSFVSGELFADTYWFVRNGP